MYPDNSLLKARMHVKTWRQNITEGGEVTIEVTEDPFPPDLRNKFADMAKDFAVRVPMTDLMNRIKSHDANRRRKIAAVNRRWSFTKSPTGWPVFTGISTFIIILAIGYLIYRCCKSVPQSPINMALGGCSGDRTGGRTSKRYGYDGGGIPGVPNLRYGSYDGCSAGHSAAVANTGNRGVDLEKTKGHHANDD